MTLVRQASPAPASAGVAARFVLLTLVAGGGLFAFVTIRPHQPWILWLTAALVALAVDGMVQANPRWHGQWLSSVVYLFLPVIVLLASGYFIDHALHGYARPVAAIPAALAVGAVAFGEYHTVDFGSAMYGPMRLLLAIATYLAAFALYTVVYSEGPGVATSAVIVGVASLALAMELLRESRMMGPSSLLAGLAIGLSIAELRLAFYFFPLDGILAGALLIIGFYLATGVVHHLLDHDLELSTMAEYLIVAGVGATAVVFTRAFV